MALKLDMSKAYDRVEWTFLEALMKRFGFSVRWIAVVMDYISSSSFSFILDGAPYGSLVPSKGLRQGFPLSPYLFLLCAEGLSILLKNEESLGNLQGFLVARLAPHVNYLFFADNSITFGRASKRDCRSMIKSL